MAAVIIPSLTQPGTNIGGRYGPFKDGSGNLWVVGFFTGTIKLCVWKSTDGGATWTTSYQATVAGSGATLDCTFDFTNGVIYAAVGVSGAIQVWKFTISTTTWAELFSSGTRPTVVTDLTYSKANASICLRSTGEVVVAYQGPTHSVMGTNYSSVYYARLSAAGVWSVGVEVDGGAAGSVSFLQACLGASDRIHIVMNNNLSLQHVSVSSANVLDTIGSVSGLYNVANNAALFYNSTMGLVCAWQGGAVVARASSIANPTWTGDTNTISPSPTNNFAPAIVYDGGGGLIIAYQTSTGIYTVDSITTTWPAGVLLDSATSPGYVSAGGLVAKQAGVVWVAFGVNFDKNVTAGPKPLTAATILATSTVGGNITQAPRVRQLVTATISATSVASGGLRRLRPVTPTTVSAISTVSGGVARLKQVTPTTAVAATSTVSGGVRVQRGIRPTTAIAATAVVSGSLRIQPRIIPTTAIAATSVVSGKVTAIHKIAGVIAATSTVGGLVTKAPVKPITGAIAATSIVSGSLRVTRRIPATVISATSVVSGSIQHIATFRGASVAATSVVSGFVQRAVLAPKPIVPTLISATSTMSGKVLTTHIVRGAVAATSVVSGRVQAIHRLVTALVAATSSISGTVSKAPVRPVSATIAATSVVSGTVATKRFIIIANVAAFSTVQGLIRVARAVMPTVVSATSTVSGKIGAIRKITGVVLATSTVTGSIYKRGIQVLVATVVSATSTVSGRVTAVRRVAGTVLATSTVAGIVRRLRPFTPAQVNATSVVSGKVVVRRAILATSISATSTVTGNLVVKRIVRPSANVFATSTVQGELVRRLAPLRANVYATSTVSGTLISKAPGSVMYFHQTGTVTHGKTGRIDYVTTGNHTAGKVGRIEPLTTGRAMEEDDSLVY